MHPFLCELWQTLTDFNNSSLMHSEMNCRRNGRKVCHLTLNMLLHCLAKLECSDVDISQNN